MAARPRDLVIALLTMLVIVAAGLLVFSNLRAQRTPAPALLTGEGWTLTSTAPVDPSCFTQGLEVREDGLLVSCGQYGESSLRVLGADGRTATRVDLPPQHFAEGTTRVGSQIWQLTWREGVLHNYESDSLTHLRELRYEGEGWGLCHDDARDLVWRSDGSANLTAHDPEDFSVRSVTEVVRDGEAVGMLNELECVDGEVWANRWMTNEIVRIDPESGSVLNTFDMSGLVERAESDAGVEAFGRDQVLNGIAYDAERGAFLVTGKEWPQVYTVEFEFTR